MIQHSSNERHIQEELPIILPTWKICTINCCRQFLTVIKSRPFKLRGISLFKKLLTKFSLLGVFNSLPLAKQAKNMVNKTGEVYFKF